MAGERKLTVILAGDHKGLSSAIGGASRDVDGLGSKMAKFGKTVAIGLGAAAIGAVALGKSFVDAAIESQKVTKQTEAVLKSMGEGAGLTAKEIGKLAEKQSMLSGVDDELIQSGQNVLLTFGKVQNKVGKGNKIFDRASQSALDMSVALGVDLKGANIQLGKALNDPIKGITALGRAGVSFTEQQKDQIKQMVKVGDTLGAQKIILGEMEKQFGGSAAAQATAGEKLKVVWGNLQEQLGQRLLPIVEKVAGWLSVNLPIAIDAASKFFDEKLVPAVKNAWTWFQDNLLPAFAAVANFIRDEVIPRLGDFGKWVADHDPKLRGLAILVGTTLVVAFGAMAASAVAAGIAAGGAIWPVTLGILVFVGAVWAANEAMQALINKFTHFPGLPSAIKFLGDKFGHEATASSLKGIDWGPQPVNLGSTKPGRQRTGIGRASGGPVSAMRPYIVGEKGPEWFVPTSNGTIIPNGGGMSASAQPKLGPTNITLVLPDGTKLASWLVDQIGELGKDRGVRYLGA